MADYNSKRLSDVMPCNVYVIPVELFIEQQPILNEMDVCVRV